MPNLINALAPTLVSNINAVQKGIVDTQTQLASGTKNLNAAEVGIVTRLSAQAAGYKSVSQNITAGINVINVASTALNSISTILSQTKDIATQAANAGLQASDRVALNLAFGQLTARITSLIANAGVNGENVLSPTGTNLTVQSGITGGVASQTTITNLCIDFSATSLNLTGTSLVTQDFAQTSIDRLTTALTTISTYQSTLSAAKTGLDASAAAALSLTTNLQATVDSIQNVDQIALQANLQQLNNQQAVDYYLVSQMNTAAASALTIFR